MVDILQTTRPKTIFFCFHGGLCIYLSVHYNDVIMNAMAFQVTSLTIVWSTVYSGADQRKHQSSTSLAFVRGIYRGPVNSPHKGPVARKTFPFDDVAMITWEMGCVSNRRQTTIWTNDDPVPYMHQQHLIHWRRDKWPKFARRHFQMHFLKIQMFEFPSKFRRSLFLRAN